MLACCTLSHVTLRCRAQQPKILSARARRAVLQLSLVFVVSVAAGNAALGYIHVSFAQAIGATAPLWTVLLSVILTRSSHPPLVYVALGLISLGMLLTVRGEINFHPAGFVLVLTATLTRALKSILQGMLLSAADERLDPLELLFHMALRAAVALGLWAVIMERSLLTDLGVREVGLWLCVLASSLVAFLLNLSQFFVTKATSAVTLQVLGRGWGSALSDPSCHPDRLVLRGSPYGLSDTPVLTTNGRLGRYAGARQYQGGPPHSRLCCDLR